MVVSEIFLLSLRQLRRNKSRSFLTMLGIIIGVFAVITLVSVGTGLKSYINAQFESLGANVLYVMPGKVGGEEGGGFSQGAPNFSGSKLKEEFAKKIVQIGEPISGATGDVEIPAIARYRSKQKTVTVVGGTTDIFQFISLEVEKGRLFNSSEVASSRKVAVIGAEVAKKLYEANDPLGQEIIISDSRLKVVGVLKSKGGGLVGGVVDSHVFIPLSSAKEIFGVKNLQTIIVRFSDKSRLDEAKYRVKTVLLQSLSEDDFSIINQASILSTISSILSVLTIALGGIAAISLLVGGIGIMNIMLVSVTERTKEIGIRKSVGARNSDILAQFVTEAVFVSLIGGIIGMILGILGALLVGKLISANALSWWSIVLAIVVSSGIGIIFGVAPAAKAAKLNPVDALRYE